MPGEVYRADVDQIQLSIRKRKKQGLSNGFQIPLVTDVSITNDSNLYDDFHSIRRGWKR